MPCWSQLVMKPSTLHSWKECQVKIAQLWNEAPCISMHWWERLKLQAMEHLLLSLNPFLFIHFFIHPSFSSIQLFHPPNFFIHPTSALCILPPPKEATGRVKGRERRPRREASLAVIKPYLVHLPCMFNYTSRSLCRSSSQDSLKSLKNKRCLTHLLFWQK